MGWCLRPNRGLTAIALVLMVSAAGQTLQGPAEETPAQPLVPDDNPLIVHTLYTWYTAASFAHATAQPLEPFDSSDPEHYRRHFTHLRANGVDVLAAVLTGRPGERDEAGRPLPTTTQVDNLLRILPLVGSAGMKTFVYYDTAIRSWWKNHLSTGELDMRRAVLREQLAADFAWIADAIVTRHSDEYLFLQRESGRPVLDEVGLARPVIAIYIARALKDDPGYPHVREVFDTQLTAAFRARGLGRPALVLDVVFWGERTFDAELVRAFGQSAFAVTSFCPIVARPDVADLGDWVPLFADLYRRAAREVARIASSDRVSEDLQLWPGIMPSFESSQIRSGRATDLTQWEDMLRTGLASTARRARPENDPIRGAVVIYTDEFFEGTPLLTANGLYTLPLTVQGNVLKEAGIWLERF